VELRTFGEATEFDRAVAEQLLDPLTQLLRNAVATGSAAEERAAERQACGRTRDDRARQDALAGPR